MTSFQCLDTVFTKSSNSMKPRSAAQEMSRLMGKPTICIGENKGADQLRGNREADQRLYFRYSESTIPLLLKSEISRLQASSCLLCFYSPVCVRPVRKPHCWFSHEAAQISKAIQKRNAFVRFPIKCLC